MAKPSSSHRSFRSHTTTSNTSNTPKARTTRAHSPSGASRAPGATQPTPALADEPLEHVKARPLEHLILDYFRLRVQPIATVSLARHFLARGYSATETLRAVEQLNAAGRILETGTPGMWMLPKAGAA